MNWLKGIAIFTLGGISVMTQLTAAQTPNASTDARIYPQVRELLAELNKDSSPFWELPQPKPQDILTGLQNKTPVDLSGVTTVEKTITEDGHTVKIYIMTPQRSAANPGVVFSSMVASGSSVTSRTINVCCGTSWSALDKSASSSNTHRFPRRNFPPSLTRVTLH